MTWSTNKTIIMIGGKGNAATAVTFSTGGESSNSPWRCYESHAYGKTGNMARKKKGSYSMRPRQKKKRHQKKESIKKNHRQKNGTAIKMGGGAFKSCCSPIQISGTSLSKKKKRRMKEERGSYTRGASRTSTFPTRAKEFLRARDPGCGNGSPNGREKVRLSRILG